MTLIDCLNDLMARDNADHIRLDDGATTWDLDNLYDVVINSPDYDEGLAYSVQDDGIYAVDADGYLVSPPAYRLKGPHGGPRPGAGRKPAPHASRKKESRRVTLPPNLWASIDAAQASMGLTRTAVIEAMAEAWLASQGRGA